jgi:hypothetical protein
MTPPWLRLSANILACVQYKCSLLTAGKPHSGAVRGSSASAGIAAGKLRAAAVSAGVTAAATGGVALSVTTVIS